MNSVFIKKIHINKVRHLENIEIVLDEDQPKHLLITGKNGSGKTSLLEAMEQHLGILEDRQRLLAMQTAERDIKILLQSKQTQEQSLENEKDPVKIIKIQHGIHQADSAIRHNKEKIAIHKKRCELDLLWLEGADLFAKNKLILAVFDAKRQIKLDIPPGPKYLNLPKKSGFFDTLSKNFMQYLVNIRTEKSYANDDNDTQTVARISTWFERFEDRLKKLFDDDSLTLKFKRKHFRFYFQSDQKEDFDFNQLSDGYSAILNIVMELMLRMEAAEYPYYDMQGIVLIDELETHLHLDLQKKILPFLCDFFPKIQFIVTTHSPFILSSISNAIIYDLERQLRIEDASAYAYDGLADVYFNNDQYSKIAKIELKRYQILIQQHQRSEDDEDEMIDLRLKLKEIPYDLAPELVTAFREVETTRKMDASL